MLDFVDSIRLGIADNADGFYLLGSTCREWPFERLAFYKTRRGTGYALGACIRRFRQFYRVALVVGRLRA